MAKYVIDGATLTEIADAIRRCTRTEQGYDIPQSITPETMPDYIETYVADSNYDKGYEQGYADGKAESEEVTDLKGKTYNIPSGWGASATYGQFSVNCDIVVDGTTLTKTRLSLGFTIKGTIKSILGLTNSIVADNGSSLGAVDGYVINNTKGFTITFNDGNTTNTSLIDWVTTWGELQSRTYEDGYNDGVNSALAEFADWSLSTTSNSCTVSITNTHPSMYLHLDFIVGEWVSIGDSYEASVIVPPNSSYSWDSGDWVDSAPSGAEWDIYINSMRFSTDGV